MSINDIDKSKLTPMMRQYVSIKEDNMDLILFFRLGDFYEMFFEDAILVSKLLEITLTKKSAGLDEKIPMCGVPHHSATVYIEKLVELGYKVAICEQLEDAKNVKGIVKRGIVRVVSRGTLINENSINKFDNNYIGNLYGFDDFYVTSYADITTGDIYVKRIIKKDIVAINEILALGLKEVIVHNVSDNIMNTLVSQFKITVTKYSESNINKYQHLYKSLTDYYYELTVNNLLSYLDETQKIEFDHLKEVEIKNDESILKMDMHTKSNLELIETKRLKERQHSLLWFLDKTKTASGARLLKRYVLNPIIDKEEINKRYDYIDIFRQEFLLKKELEVLLDEVYDLERLSGRVVFGNSNARDLLQLKKTIEVLPSVNQILKQIKYEDSLVEMKDLYELLENAIYENPPIGLKEGFLIKEGFNSELDELKDIRKSGKNFLAKFELEEREKTGIKTLKVGYNRVFGYYIEVSKGSTNLVKDEYGYERKQTLSNCERYISPILKEKEALILNAEEKIVELEYTLFLEIREKIKTYIRTLQKNSDIISKIDVLQSFATIADIHNLVRPIITEDHVIDIKDNRHPIIEMVSDFEFVPNDITLDESADILLITGPNMAGKSTYIRQFAITMIMAQIGSFVPASYAKIFLTDAIFTRIGSSDDLVSGESTFMVEMNEANDAISHATNKSLILFDELGRGTATFDGIAISQAIIEHIHDNIGAKSLFSTHYHELTDLEKTLNKLKNIHVSALEEDGHITFLHKIKEGSVDKSYGIHVARLAKLPEDLIKRANDILHVYENTEQRREVKINKIKEVKKDSEIEKEIEQIDLSNLTPIDSINLLYKLQKEIREMK